MPDTSKLEKLNRELEKSEKKLRKAINDEKALQASFSNVSAKRVLTSKAIRKNFWNCTIRFQNRKIKAIYKNCAAGLPRPSIVQKTLMP